MFCSYLTSVADVITPDKALDIAKAFWGDTLSVASSGVEEPTLLPAPTRRRSPGQRQFAPGESAPYYVVNRGADRGFVIVSGDDLLPDILGYTDNGTFDMDGDMPPALLELMDSYASSVEYARANNVDERSRQLAMAAGRRTIGPLVTAHWGQGGPYNDQCPLENGSRCLAGCVAVAIAQVLYYYRPDLPRELQSSTTPYGKVTNVYKKGTPMRYELLRDSYGGSIPSEYREEVATFMAAVGAAAQLDYGTGGTAGYSYASLQRNGSLFGYSNTSDYDHSYYSDEAWIDLIYQRLNKYMPQTYSISGHAIVVDGYDANTNKCHFNYGWSGSADGWYSISLKKGEGIDTYQALHSINDLRYQNLSGSITLSDTVFYKGVYSDVKIHIDSHSSYTASGFKVYLSTSPDRVSTTSATFTESVEPGKSIDLTTRLRSLSAKDYWIHLLDSHGHTLDKKKVSVIESSPSLSLQKLDATASSDTVLAGDVPFRVLYNNRVTLSAFIGNEATATPGQPNVRFTLYRYDPATGQETESMHRTVTTTVCPPGAITGITSLVTGLQDSVYYVARMTANDVSYATPDSLVRFVVREPSLQLDTIAGGIAFLRGGWDEAIFSDLSKDPSIVGYDVTAVTGVTDGVIPANPNALLYATGTVTGRNIVRDGRCERLELSTAYDFSPREPFHASEVTLSASFVPSLVRTLVLPFDCAVPDGWLCRTIDELSSSAVKSMPVTDHIQSSVPVLAMCDSRTPQPFTATDVDIASVCDTTANALMAGSFRSLSVALLPPHEGSYWLALDGDVSANTHYFERTDTTSMLAPFEAVLLSTSKKVRASANSTAESFYVKLSAAIDEAQALYDQYSVVVTDSANTTMEEILVRARAMFTTMSSTDRTTLTSLTRDVTSFSRIYPLMIARVTDAIDYTAYLTNPSFESKSKSGWDGDSYTSVADNTDLTLFATPIDGGYYAYNSKKGGSSELSQTIEGLPNGYYRLTAEAGTSVGDTVTLFANDVESPVVGSPYGKHYMTLGIVNYAEVTDGTLTIGVRAGNSWYKVDDFKLYYLGKENAISTGMRDILQDPEMMDEADEIVEKGIYDLTGRRVTNPTCGIYIINGKKVLLK